MANERGKIGIHLNFRYRSIALDRQTIKAVTAPNASDAVLRFGSEKTAFPSIPMAGPLTAASMSRMKWDSVMG